MPRENHHATIGGREENLGFARVDLDRQNRCGFPEVVFGQGKSPSQIAEIMTALVDAHGRALATRVDADHVAAVMAALPDALHHELARCLVVQRVAPPCLDTEVAVVCAGTSDIPVAEEAVCTLEALGCTPTRIYDVGVAGIHRLIARRDDIERASLAIVVAGMEGALPSAVAGLVSTPVIAVPTSVGYGASFHGLAALLGMLNSCGSGVTVVNIDNGFGAAYAAASIARSMQAKISESRPRSAS